MARLPLLKPASGTNPVLDVRRCEAASLDVIAEPLLRRLADYWLTLRAGRLMPARADIDPLDIPWALSRLFLADCVTDAGPGADGAPWRWRYRLAGEEVEAVFRGIMGRHSMRDVWLDDMLTPDNRAAVSARWRPLPARGCIVYMQGMVYRMADCHARGGRIMLPLADRPGGAVTGMIGAVECDWQADTPPRSGPSDPDLTFTYIPAAALA